MQNRNIKRVAKEKFSRNNIQNLAQRNHISSRCKSQIVHSSVKIYVMQKGLLGPIDLSSVFTLELLFGLTSLEQSAEVAYNIVMTIMT